MGDDRGGFIRVSTIEQHEQQMTNEEWEEEWDRLAGYYGAEHVTLEQMLDNLLRVSQDQHVSDEVIYQALLEADSNKDGLISKQEFFNIKSTTPPSGVLRRLVRQAAWCVVPASERDLQQRKLVERCSFWPPPVFILVMSLAQVTTFIFYAVDMDLPVLPMSPCPTYSPLVYDPARRYEAWRYVSYMFIHSGWLHLVSNLVTQLMFGLVLEFVHGPVRLCGLYLAGVVCGALATSVATPRFFLAGASGGVYAVQYAHVANLIINWDELHYPVPQAVVISVISVVDISYSIYDTFYVASASHTGHVAHIGGAVAGLLLGICLLKNIKQIDWERYCKLGAAILLSLLVLVTVLVNCLATSYYPENDYRSHADVRQSWMAANHLNQVYLGP